MSTFLQLCQKFRKVVGISGSGPAAVTDQTGMYLRIVTWVADAEWEVITKWGDWPFMLVPKAVIPVTAGTATYTLTDLAITDLARWKPKTFVVKPGTANYLSLPEKRTHEDYLKSEYYLGAGETGDLVDVVVNPVDNSITFIPTPTETQTVWAGYFKTPTRLSGNTSQTPIPERYEDIILAKAKMFYAEAFDNQVLLQIASMQYEDWMRRMERELLPGFLGMGLSSPEINEPVRVE
jgi:hypothetical protein